MVLVHAAVELPELPETQLLTTVSEPNGVDGGSINSPVDTETEQSIPWPNDNWRLLSKVVNSCHMSDREGNFFLETLRSIDFSKSIPNNISVLRNFEAVHVGTTM